MADHGSYRYAPAAGHGLARDPFNAIVGPRPIGWISTRSADGVANLAPYSFFNAFNYTPPIVGFASIGEKDSLANARATGVFCWNLATRPLAEAMNLTSAPAPAEIDEFAIAPGLSSAPGDAVDAPRVRESPVNFECRVTQIVDLVGLTGAPAGSSLVFGEVVLIHIDQRLLGPEGYDALAAEPILRWGGGGDYVALDAAGMFRMRRPSWPLG